MNATRHISLDELADYLAGSLTADAIAEIKAHLSGCPACAQNAAFLERLNAAAQAAAWPAPPAWLHRRVAHALHLPQTARHLANPAPLRRLVPLALTVLALLVVLVITLRPVPAFAASLSNISGRVEVRLTSSGAWQMASSGQTLPVGAAVRTDADGKVDLLFPGGDRVQLAPGTQLLLSQAVRSDGKWKVVLQQTTGGVETWVQSGSNGYSLETSAGEVMTSGAHFQVTVQEGGATSVSVDDGEVQVNSTSGSTTLGHGEMTVFSPGNGPTTLPVPSPESSPTPGENSQPGMVPPVQSNPPFDMTPVSPLTSPGMETPTPTN